jgi:hypothetical protein
MMIAVRMVGLDLDMARAGVAGNLESLQQCL